MPNGLYDWVKRALETTLPRIPPPFDWIGDFINVHVFLPSRRTFEEIRRGLNLVAAEIVDLWEHRSWYIKRLRIKFDSAVSEALRGAESFMRAMTKKLSRVLDELKQAVDTEIRPRLNTAYSKAKQAWEDLQTFLTSTWESFLRTYGKWRNSVQDVIDVVKLWTIDTIRYWLWVYDNYRSSLVAFLDNPTAFVLAHVEDRLGQYAEGIRRLGATLLDIVW
ncbi:MAG: hypothetical protein ACTSPX_01285 [Candidatus Thorarchaeota archaeon]